jgi:hypothetical protein
VSIVLNPLAFRLLERFAAPPGPPLGGGTATP